MIDIDTDRALATFLELVQIDSPTYEERPIIERIARELEALGLPAFNDRTGRTAPATSTCGCPARAPICRRSCSAPTPTPSSPAAASAPRRARRRRPHRRAHRSSAPTTRRAWPRCSRPSRTVDPPQPAAPRCRPGLHLGRGARARRRRPLRHRRLLRATMGVTLDDTADPGAHHRGRARLLPRSSRASSARPRTPAPRRSRGSARSWPRRRPCADDARAHRSRDHRQHRPHPRRHRSQLRARAGGARGRGPQPRQRQARAPRRAPPRGVERPPARRQRRSSWPSSRSTRPIAGLRARLSSARRWPPCAAAASSRRCA